MSLYALVEKWRGDAKQHREQFALLGGEQYNAPGGIIDMAITCEEHADELAAALAGGGEAVAWVDRSDVEALASGKCSRTDVFANKHDGDDVPLYLHPAGAVQVTDEMVELAEDFFYDNSPFNGQDELREGLRGCLNAALNPGGSRDHD